MDNKYIQGRSTLQSVTVGSNLYKLSNGNLIRIYSCCDDPEYEYGYDYFDGSTKKLIDGGVFNHDAGSEQEVLEEALGWCDLDVNKITWTLLQEDVEYDDLEDMGYSGF